MYRCIRLGHYLAHTLIRRLEDAGVRVKVTISRGGVFVQAVGADSQTHRHERDDGELLAAVREVVERCGPEFS